SLGLPPLNPTLARRMMERTRIYTALKGVRGRKPVDLHALEQIMVRFSQLIADHPWIKELDINPLMVSPERIIALDARVVVHEEGVPEEKLPGLSIRPYPSKYVKTCKTKNGTPITLCPVRPEDESLLVKFHENLSDRTVYMRYLHPMLLSTRAAHERLSRICHCDYDREITLIAEIEDPETGEVRVIGAGRLSKIHSLDEGRCSVLISDLYHGQGVGTALMKEIIQISKDEKLRRIEVLITPDNQVMRTIFARLGFTISDKTQNHLVTAEMYL
ncbi:MAG: GNAT family N-acetyltransferase, partial [Anaerolineales bacterium]|nr:GNAT family N-acetyltransferase [Anaerolineales bacterium]